MYPNWKLYFRHFNEVWEGFRALDMDEDVRISLTDLHKVESVTSNLSYQQIEHLFQKIDTSENGYMEFQEFAEAYATALTIGI